MQGSLMMIAGFVAHFCAERGITPVVTDIISTLEEDQRIGRKSSTHRTGRAIDYSLRHDHGWTNTYIAELESEINEKFSHVGALVDVGGELVSRPIVVHESKDSNGNPVGVPHAHIQVRPE